MLLAHALERYPLMPMLLEGQKGALRLIARPAAARENSLRRGKRRHALRQPERA
jgi:hypothetical protein